MSELPQQILLLIDKNGSVNSLLFSQEINEPHQKIVGAIKSLGSLGNVVTVVQKCEKNWICTDEGTLLAQDGSHEVRLFNSILPEGRIIADIKVNFPNGSIAMGAALKNKWVKKTGDLLERVVSNVEDEVQQNLQAVINGKGSDIDLKVRTDYKKRKLIKEIDITLFEVTKGPEFTTTVSKQDAELTKEMIETGNWKDKSFKPFNFQAKGKLDHRSGYLHPLMQLRAEFRQIFLEMGFSEMPTNAFVESAFWNFDALFQPQQHPARDLHDTFYVSDPPKTLQVPEDYLQRVCETHSKGGYGSEGYKYDWSRDEAHKNLLRTHTTAVSARMLYKLAQDGFKPAKYFSIDRVFRNETLDATHLAEFHQIEGVVADYNLSIKHLMGLFTVFFEKIGITKLRFKPAYNPYTEPSMEIFSFHEGLDKWVEVGNSGIFRPEMLRPMGLPEDVTVIAWGLSLERPTMIKCGINNIRELVGPRVKLELILENAICTVDKFKNQRKSSTIPATIESLTLRQERILQKLSDLQSRVVDVAKQMGVDLPILSLKSNSTNSLTGGLEKGIVHDVVVAADPERPPYSIRSLIMALMSYGLKVKVSIHCHSSIQKLSDKHLQFFHSLMPSLCDLRSSADVCLTLIWKKMSNSQPQLSVSPLSSCQIFGEGNICRYLARLIDMESMKNTCKELNLLYEIQETDIITKIDEYLDDSETAIASGNNRLQSAFMKKLENTLSRDTFVCGNNIKLADIVILSLMQQFQLNNTKNKCIQRWINNCLNHKWGRLLV